jgi:5-methylcytosine-specific restriction protein B
MESDSVDPARNAFAALLPDVDLRTKVSGIFAKSITEANGISPGSWVVTFSEQDSYIGFDTGRVFGLNLTSGSLSVLLDPEPVDLSDPRFESWEKPTQNTPLKSNANLTWRTGPIEEIVEHWGILEKAHLAAVRQTAHQVSYSTYAKHHQPGLCEEIGRLAGIELPQPRRRPEPGFDLDDLAWLINRQFPEWEGFRDTRFEKDEVAYKLNAASKARDRLNRDELERLIEAANYDEFISRLKMVGQSTNLLYLGVPSAGDLNILFDEGLEKGQFSRQIFELFHGDGEVSERLATYLDWIQRQGLPNNWTFPTYFLFLLYPESELFIKPKAIEAFLKLLDPADSLTKRPSAEEYTRIRGIAQGLFDSMAEHEPRDMIDIQSLIWVCGSVRFWKIAPGEGARLWERQREGSYIGLGWDELGDLSEVKRKEDWETRAAKFIGQEHGWTKEALNQLWLFRSSVSEGDVIVANQGTTKVLGIGTVTGPYSFEEKEEFRHRVPVRWDDIQERTVDFGGWRRTLIQLTPKDMKIILDARPVPPPPPPHEDSAFTDRAFELLGMLKREPKKTLYDTHKGEFHSEVESPFQGVMSDAADGLAAPILDLMETESRVFSRIPKNDWGRGGAWPAYWGAFYPKGGKRIEDAQLFLSINYERLDFGFYIGEYGSDQRQRFLRNLQSYREALGPILQGFVDSDDLLYGSREEFFVPDGPQFAAMRDWKGWLEKSAASGIRAGVIINRDEALATARGDLVDRMRATFERVFPLVLLATFDDPMPQIAAYIGEDEGEGPEIAPTYGLDELAADTNIPRDDLEAWRRALERKGQVVFYGPPGTGKTFVAERMARHVIAGGDGFYQIVQFHPAYAYEDFIQGIRPRVRPDGAIDFRLEPGRFLQFCSEAKRRENTCVLIIDEINRANLSRVFGELMYLLEYRGQTVPLAGGGTFEIPPNVRLIGTMNTADRSIALVDHALRRRFAFIPLYPQFEILRQFHSTGGFDPHELINVLERLNRAIGDRHYEIGISFFLKDDLNAHLESIWRMEIEPYLEEYFFDQAGKVDEFRWDKIKHRVIE